MGIHSELCPQFDLGVKLELRQPDKYQRREWLLLERTLNTGIRRMWLGNLPSDFDHYWCLLFCYVILTLTVICEVFCKLGSLVLIFGYVL